MVTQENSTMKHYSKSPFLKIRPASLLPCILHGPVVRMSFLWSNDGVKGVPSVVW